MPVVKYSQSKDNVPVCRSCTQSFLAMLKVQTPCDQGSDAIVPSYNILVSDLVLCAAEEGRVTSIAASSDRHKQRCGLRTFV